MSSTTAQQQPLAPLKQGEDESTGSVWVIGVWSLKAGNCHRLHWQHWPYMLSNRFYHLILKAFFGFVSCFLYVLLFLIVFSFFNKQHINCAGANLGDPEGLGWLGSLGQGEEECAASDSLHCCCQGQWSTQRSCRQACIPSTPLLALDFMSVS